MSHSINTIRRAEQILGYGIGTGTGAREYPVIDGVIYTDLFEGDLNVELPFEYRLAFNGKVGHTTYYNEIIVKSKCKSTVEVDAVWGSCEFDKEIKERKRTGFFGDSYDHETWDAFYKAVCNEIERRKGNES